MKLSPRAGLLIVVVLWAGNFTATKLSFREFDPFAFTAIRFTLACAVLVALAWRDPDFRRLPAGALPRLLLLGIVGNTLYQLCFVGGLSRTSATNSALILASMPSAVTFAAGALGIERVTGRQRIATLIATAGVVIVLSGRAHATPGEGLGDLIMLGSVLFWTAYTLLVRKMAIPISALSLTTWTTLLGTPGLVIVAVPVFVRSGFPRVSGAAWGGLLYAALLSLIVAYMLWNRAVRAIGASRAAVYTCLTPLIAAAIAAVGLGERPTWVHALGAVLIIAGVLGSQGAASAPTVASSAKA